VDHRRPAAVRDAAAMTISGYANSRLRATADRNRHPAGWRTLCDAGMRRRLAPGAVLTADDGSAPGVVLVERGAVKLVGVADNGHSAVLSVRTAGSLIGDFAAAVDDSRATSIVGLLPADIVTVPAPRLPDALRTRPATALLVESAVAGLHEEHRRRMEYAAYGVSERICRVLAELADLFRPDRAGEPTVVPLVQSDVAGLAAASRETTAKVLRRLRGNGAVCTQRSRIVILRIELIAAEFSADPDKRAGSGVPGGGRHR
jgi:CRP/FNR family transcriptional regulator, cyclic AMP receptor protein